MGTRCYLCAWIFLAATVGRGEEAGQVLILDNERTLEGTIERVGDQYRIRRGGGETLMPGKRVLKVCGSKKEALEFLRERANLDDPDERLRLARWCHLQGMMPEAQIEVKAALALRPKHDESLRLSRYLDQAARYAAVKKSTAPAAPPAAVEVKAPPPIVAVTGDTLGQFTTRVQPILMNACARCHCSAEHASAFRLVRNSSGINRRIVQENLAAVLGQLHGEDVEKSPFLVKAISAHGTAADPPLKGRQLEAFKVLQDWVRLTMEKNPQLRATARADVAIPDEKRAPIELERAVETPKVKTPAAPARTDVAIRPSPTPMEEPRTVPTRAKPVEPPPEMTPVEDEPPVGGESEFDAVHFNRLMHPRGKPKSAP